MIEEKDQSKQCQEHLTQPFNSGLRSRRETGRISPDKICHNLLVLHSDWSLTAGTKSDLKLGMELSKRECEDNQNQKQLFLDAGSIFHKYPTPSEGKDTHNLNIPIQVSKLMPVFTETRVQVSKAGYGQTNTSLENQKSSSVHENSNGTQAIKSQHCFCTSFSSEPSCLPVLFNLPKKMTCSCAWVLKDLKQKRACFRHVQFVSTGWQQGIALLTNAWHTGASSSNTAEPPSFRRMLSLRWGLVIQLWLSP